MSERVGGLLKRVRLGDLRPDWRNPRFPPRAVDGFTSDMDVYAYLDRQFDAVSVAESIARHGYFESEPLIAIPIDGEKQLLVVEGNRRLAALQGLASAEVRARMTDPRWSDLPTDVDLPDDLPVLVAGSREQVAPILGYRHVTGIAPWDPYQQARYVASLIDEEGSQVTAADVAQLIGRELSEVRAFYRNYSIVEQARDVFELPDSERMVDEFGVWNRAMTSVGLRDYISAPTPRDVVEREYPLVSESAAPLERLLLWIFGAPRSREDIAAGRQSKESRVITDSRQLTRLGKAVAHPRGRETLEAGGTLAQAEKAMLDRGVRFVAALDDAHAALSTAEDNRPAKLTRVHIKKLDEIEAGAQRVRAGQ